MRLSNPNTKTRREHARRLNRVVDRALMRADKRALAALLEVAAEEETVSLCSRISRRAALLARHDPSKGLAIVLARNRRVMEIYGHRTPKGWFSAWCDGSSISDAGGKRSGIGVVLMDAQHRVVAEFGESAGALSPLAAELAALKAALRAAVVHRAVHLRVYTDCPALIHLWQGRGDDDRLAGVRQAADSLGRLQLYLVPRRFNQVANNLARHAASGMSRNP